MNTREVVERQPENIRYVIEQLRKDYKNPALDKDEISAHLYGYTRGLRDAGAITERERQILFLYGTV